MKTRGTDQRSVLSQRLLRKLSRREGTALTLPLALALIGNSVARERDTNVSRSDVDRTNGTDTGHDRVVAKPGDKLALFAGDKAIAEHLLTEADTAAGQVRIALRMIKDSSGNATLHGVPTAHAAAGEEVSASGTADPEQVQVAEQASGSAAGESGDAGGAVLAQSGDRETIVLAAAGDTATAAAAATQEDDDHHGLIWLFVGIGAAGAGIALANGHHGNSHDTDTTPPPPPPSSVSGQVIKGYIHGAAVYLDKDHDGLPDGEPVYTDAQGRFTFQGGDTHASVIAYGGVDTLTNVPLEAMILRAPAGATVVTPLTTLIDEMMRQDSSLSASQAQAKLVAALGITLPAGADLLKYDSVQNVSNGGAGIEDRSEAVLSTLSAVQSLLTAAGAADAVDAANAAISALAQVILEQGNVDLSSASDIRSVLEPAFERSGVGASSEDDLTSLAGAIAAVNGKLMEATGLDDASLQATRYALSGFQDLLTSIGAGAHATEQYAHDISFGSSPELASAVQSLANGNIAEAIGAYSAASISYTERLEGGRFVFALNPELKLYQGTPDKIDTITVKFDVEGVLVQRETRGENGELSVETLTEDANGRYTIQYSELDKIFITPPTQFNGLLSADVTVHYVALDVTDAPGALGIDIVAVNDAPSGVDSTVVAVEDEPYVFTVADFPLTDATDAAYAGGANALGAVKILSLPESGTLYLNGQAITANAVADGLSVTAEAIASGLLTFVPAPNANGPSNASFRFQVQDDGGTAHGGVDLDPTVHTLTVDVRGVNDAPVASGKTVSMSEDQAHTFELADFAFTDIENNSLAAVRINTAPANGTLYYGEDAISVGKDGYVVSAEDIAAGKLVFVPSADFNGQVSIGYQVQDNGGTANGGKDLSNTAIISLDLASVNDAPVASGKTVSMSEDQSHTFELADFAFTDIENNSLAAVRINTAPANGTLYYGEDAISVGEDGYVVSAGDIAAGKLVFVPNADLNGQVSIGYQVQDNGGTDNGGRDTSETATLTFEVAAVNDAPSASDNTIDTNEDAARVLQLSDFKFADIEGNDIAGIILTGLPEHGALYYRGNLLTPDDLGEDGLHVTSLDIEDGALAYNPVGDYNGSDTFTYKVQDDGGGSTDTSVNSATLTIDVNAVNDAPLLSLPNYSNCVTPVADGEHYLVNTTTTGNQEAPAIAALSDGGYVVVWISDGQDHSGYGVYAQRYAANGEKAGAEIRINTNTTGDQFDATVVARPDGGFTVVWSSQPYSDSNNASIAMRSFDACGQPLTEESVVNTTTTNLHFEPTIAATQNGTVIVWTADGANGYDIYAQLYDADGAKIGDEVRVNTSVAFDQFEPAVAVLNDGSYVITWTGRDGTGDVDSRGVFAQRFNADGTKNGEEVRINADCTGDQTQPAIAALNDGGYVVTWTGQDDSLTRIYAQRYDASGCAVGEQVLVNTVQINEQIDPAVTALPTGGYVITWTSWGSADSTLDVYAQRFGVDGIQLGEPVLVNAVTRYEQGLPAIAVLADGSVVVSWQSNNEDGSGYGIYAQRSQPIAPNYIEGGAPVVIAPMAKVSDVELDALNEGQGNWTGASIVVERQSGHKHHQSPDHFGFKSGDGYELLDDGTLIKGGQPLGHFSVDDGKLVVTFGPSVDFGIQEIGSATTPTTADVNYVLQHITYWNSSDNPGDSVTLSYRVEDGNAELQGAQGSGGEASAQGTVVVQLTNVNDAPEPLHNTVHMREDEPHTFDLWDFRFHDAEHNGLLSVTIKSLPEHGTLFLDGQPVTLEQIECGLTLTREDLVCGRLTFTPDENFSGKVSFGYLIQDDGDTARGGRDTSEVATMRLDVRAVNDAPELVVCTSHTVCYTEGQEATLLTPGAHVSDVDLDAMNGGLGDWSGASITIGRKDVGEDTSDDQYGFVNCDGLTFVDGNIKKTVGGVESVIGSYSGNDDGKLAITFSTAEGVGSAIPTSEDVSHVLQQVTYSNTSDNPERCVTLQYLVEDGNRRWHGSQGLGGEGHATGEITVNITPVNDAPTFETPPVVTLEEDHRYTFSTSDFKFDDKEHDDLDSVIIKSLPTNGTLFFNCEAVTQEQVNCGLSVSAEELRCGLLVFEPNENHYGSISFDFQVKDSGGTSNGGQDTSAETTFTFNIRSVNDAPELTVSEVSCGDGPSVDYTAGGDPVLLAPAAEVADVELDALNDGDGNWSGATITVRRQGGANTDDVFGHYIDMGGRPSLVWNDDDGTITKSGAVIATFSSANGELHIHFTGYGTAIPTNSDVNGLLQQITYSNASTDPDRNVTIEYVVADGNLSFHGPQGSGGEGVTVGTVAVNITPLELGTPTVTLAAGSDTANVGDGITSATQPQLHVELPDHAYVGNLVKIYAEGTDEPVATHALTEEDLTQGWVSLQMEEAVTGKIVAQIVGQNGNNESALSAPFFLVYDAAVPDAPALDFDSVTLRADDAASYVLSGTAEALSTVSVRLSAQDNEPVTYTTMADAEGNFSLQVNASALGTTVAVTATAMDSAGNTSDLDTATLNIVASTPAPSVLPGTPNGDFLAPAIAPEDGVLPAVTFMPGTAGGEDYLLAQSNVFSKVAINGSSADYTITLVDGSERETREAILSEQSLTLDGNQALYRVENWADSSSLLWVQANTLEFTDGSVRLTTNGIIGGSLTNGRQVLHGGAGDDHIVAGVGDDTLFGHQGVNVLMGNDGNDTLVSSAGKDTLIGGAGNDTLAVFGDEASGEGSTATLLGGEGKDVFVIAPQSGFDRDITIQDFVIGEDKIDLSWLHVEDGSGVRDIAPSDLNVQELTADFQDDGSAQIDLAQFCMADGSQVHGTLTVTLAGGVSTLAPSDFTLDPVLSTVPLDELLAQAQLQSAT